MNEVCAMVLSECYRQGADQAEIYVEEMQKERIVVQGGHIKAYTENVTSGLAIRFIKNKSEIFISSTNLARNCIRSLIKDALNITSLVKTDVFDFPCGNRDNNLDCTYFDPTLNVCGFEEKVMILADMEKEILQNKHVLVTNHALYEQQVKEIHIINSSGLSRSARTGYCVVSLMASFSENGNIELGGDFGFGRNIFAIKTENILKNTQDRGLMYLRALPGKTRRCPAVFDSYVMSAILNFFGNAVSGNLIISQASIFCEYLGEQVASPVVNIIDDGLVYEGMNSSPFDAEGLERQVNFIVQAGKLKTFLWDTKSAKTMARKSTGNSYRGSFQQYPVISFANLILKEGIESQEALISDIDNGLYITDLTGAHTGMDPVNGNISLGAKGVSIRNGRKTATEKNVIISANLISLLSNIKKLANDCVWQNGNIKTPSALIEDVVISGA